MPAPPTPVYNPQGPGPATQVVPIQARGLSVTWSDTTGTAVERPDGTNVTLGSSGIGAITVYASNYTGNKSGTYFCTGTGDEAVINAAIAAVAALGGGIVSLSPGLFSTAHEVISTYNNVSIWGAGKAASVIKPSAGWTNINANATGAVCFVGASGFECAYLGVDLSLRASATNGIIAVPTVDWATNCTNGRIHDCDVTSPKLANYLFWSQNAQYMKWYANTGNGGATTYDASIDQQGIEVFGGYDVEVYGNFMQNIGGMAYLCQSISSTVPNNTNEKVRFHHNTANKCRTGIRFSSSYDGTNGAADLIECSFDNNTINNVYAIGCQLYPGSGNANTPPAWRGVKVILNTFRGAPSGGATECQGFYAQNSIVVNKTITGISKANPGVITSVGHGLTAGANLYISGVGGMVEFANGFYTVNTAATDTFTVSRNGTPFDTTGFTTYTSGGTVNVLLTNFEDVQVLFNQFLDFPCTSTVVGVAQITAFDNIKFMFNTVKNTAVAAASNYSFICVGDGATNIIVTDNEFDGCVKGSATLDTAVGIDFSRNHCYNWNQAGGGFSGIYLNGCIDVKCSDNELRSNIVTNIGTLINLGSANGVTFRGNEYIGFGNRGFDLYNPSTATNTNIGVTPAPSASATTVTVTTNRCLASSNVIVTQNAGTANVPKTVVCSKGSFVITIAAAAGNETYAWQIV